MNLESKNLVSAIRYLILVTIMTIIIQNIVTNNTFFTAYSLVDSSSVNSSSMWTTGATMPTPRTDFTGSSLNEKIYIIGGFNNKGKTLDTVEFYNPKTDTWSTASSLPEPRDHAASASYNDKLYVVGGYNINPSDKLFIYTHQPINGRKLNHCQQLEVH
jgi:hypothetical protein